MRFRSVCSGIEAASVAWKPLGWECVEVAEIEPFPCAVLTHRYPEVPNAGDFTSIRKRPQRAIAPADLLVGGTPCQSFSVAGLRKGLDDDRGQLMLEFLRLAHATRPRWVVWENVPGVLSSGGGRDFGSFLGGLAELGYGWAYRVLDAQHLGVPQRRRRVFVVGHLGDWRRAAAVLFERHSLSGDPPPGRSEGAVVADSLEASLGRRCGQPNCGSREGHLIPEVSLCLNAGGMRRQDLETETLIAHRELVTHTLRGDGFDASEDGTGRGTPLLPVPIDMRQASRGGKFTNNRAEGSSGGPPGTGIGEPGDPSPTVSTSHPPAVGYPVPFDTTQITSAANYSHPKAGDPCHPLASTAHPPAIAFQERGRDQGRTVEWQEDLAYCQDVKANGGAGSSRWIAWKWAVRRLTPLECERLQGFPDGWTLVPFRGKPAADGPRYKSIGNSIAVPVIRWIGERIAMVEAIG